MATRTEYADQRYIMRRVAMRREVLLPDDTTGTPTVQVGSRVDPGDVVARGFAPSRHHIVNAAEALRLRNPADLNALMLVEIGDQVTEGQAIAGRNPTRGRRALSPVEGVLVAVTNGRMIIRAVPEKIELQAGIRGEVVELYNRRGVVIQTSGAVVQGVWGNERRAVGRLRMEPADGIEFVEGDAINLEYRGAIVITKNPLAYTSLVIIQEQNIAGVIAPSMDSSLMPAVLELDRAVLLTEGFGDMPMSTVVVSMLTNLLDGQPNLQATLDAVMPSALGARRPEMLVNVPIKEGERPRTPRTEQQIAPGVAVRVTRAPYTGQTGKVTAVLDVPKPLENGLRVPGAIVEFAGGESVLVPTANLEIFAG